MRISNLKFNKKIVILVLSIYLSTTSVFAIEEKMSIEKHAVLNIKDCVEIALQNSPKIKKARYNYGIAKGNVGIAKSGYFPTLGVGTGYNITENRTSKANTSSNIYSAEASINQLLWNFGKINANINMYNFNKDAALYEF